MLEDLRVLAALCRSGDVPVRLHRSALPTLMQRRGMLRRVYAVIGEFLAEPRLRQVYCSPRCRAEADRRRGAARDLERARRLGENTPTPATPAAPGSVFRGDTLAPAVTRNCPHCQQPITIGALLATPEAARPHITQPGAEVMALKRV